jgi:hypothetical protein
MKRGNSLYLFIFSILLASCFNEPEFSEIPRIKFEGIYFGKSNIEDNPDSLVLTLTFEDGNGDLGLNESLKAEPFHEHNYFLGENDQVLPIGLKEVYADLPLFLSVPTGSNGQLILKSNHTNFPNLPDYDDPYSCIYYRIDSVFINQDDKDIIPAGVTPRIMTSNNGFPDIYIVKDTLYFQKNENFTNIDVRFFRKPNQNSEFVEIDWYTVLCGQDFNGRFPVLSEKDNALSGTIKYTMASSQFENIMGTGIWQLKIQIKDRTLNPSNVVETREFTLQDITQ